MHAMMVAAPSLARSRAIYPLFAVLAVATIVMQKIALAFGTVETGSAIGFNSVLLWSVLAWWLMNGTASVSAARLLLLLLFTAVMLASLIGSTGAIKYPSMGMLWLSYATLAVRIEVSEDTARRCFNAFQVSMLGVAGIVLAQQAIQYTVGHAYWPDLERVVNANLLYPGFAYHRPYVFGSPYDEPNAVFFLEPSAVSFYLAIAIGIELAMFRRLGYLAGLVVGMFACLAGSGPLGLVLTAPFWIVKLGRKWLMVLMLAGVPLMLVAAASGSLDHLVARSGELHDENSSGYARIVVPLQSIAEEYDRPGSTLTGSGPGTSPKALNISPWPFSKLYHEYGLLTAASFHLFLLVCVLDGPPILGLSLLMAVTELCFGGGFLSPANVLPLVMFGSLLRIGTGRDRRAWRGGVSAVHARLPQHAVAAGPRPDMRTFPMAALVPTASGSDGTHDWYAPLVGLPELKTSLAPVPAQRRCRLVTPLYGSLRQSFSGSTWYLAQAGMDEGVLDGAFTLNVTGKGNLHLHAAGALWKLGQALRKRKSGGFKFASSFSDILWSQHIHRFRNMVVLNNTQIYGRQFLDHHERFGIVPSFYIDGTLADYFYGYGRVEQPRVSAETMREAISIESKGYERAARIIAMSQAAQRSLVKDYGVEPGRIAVVTPGANIDDRHVPLPSPHAGWHGPEFVLGFVGLFPLRKGLDTLAQAVRILRGRGTPVRLRVIGRCPDEIASMDGVDFLGAIDKNASPERFVEAIRTVDLGCQLSRAELMGIAILEFLRVGVPAMATAVGGAPDVLGKGGGLLLAADVTAEAVAEEVQALMDDGSRYNALRLEAVAQSAWASWRRAARDIDAALSPVETA